MQTVIYTALMTGITARRQLTHTYTLYTQTTLQGARARPLKWKAASLIANPKFTRFNAYNTHVVARIGILNLLAVY